MQQIYLFFNCCFIFCCIPIAIHTFLSLSLYSGHTGPAPLPCHYILTLIWYTLTFTCSHTSFPKFQFIPSIIITSFQVSSKSSIQYLRVSYSYKFLNRGVIFLLFYASDSFYLWINRNGFWIYLLYMNYIYIAVLYLLFLVVVYIWLYTRDWKMLLASCSLKNIFKSVFNSQWEKYYYTSFFTSQLF